METGFGTAEPHIEYGWHVAAFPIDGERASVEQDENYRLARGKKGPEQLSLNVRDADIGTGRALTGHL